MRAAEAATSTKAAATKALFALSGITGGKLGRENESGVIWSFSRNVVQVATYGAGAYAIRRNAQRPRGPASEAAGAGAMGRARPGGAAAGFDRAAYA